ncbi:hypothetical protein O181_123537, partial [Austropuccinia psidii MF-1]|nr:hypothetical protein [Austropuccinia psidii MF-1]
MQLIDSIKGLFIDVPSIPDYCHNAVCQTSAKGTLAEKAIKPVEIPINTGK